MVMREGKTLLQKKNTYSYKQDTITETNSYWSAYKPFRRLSYYKSVSYKKKAFYVYIKEWADDGSFSEIIDKRQGKYWLSQNKKWQKGKIKEEIWKKSWRELTDNGYQVKRKLLRRKTYKDGKLIKDEKFE